MKQLLKCILQKCGIIFWVFICWLMSVYRTWISTLSFVAWCNIVRSAIFYCTSLILYMQHLCAWLIYNEYVCSPVHILKIYFSLTFSNRAPAFMLCFHESRRSWENMSIYMIAVTLFISYIYCSEFHLIMEN